MAARQKKVIVMASSNFSSGAGAGEKLSPGDRVGGGLFLLKRLLGRGEISEVWLAQDIKNSRQVALKFLPPAFLSDANLIERLKQDAQRHRLLAHPNIAATYEFMRDHSSAAVVVEFVEGWSLATLKVDKLCRCYHVGEIERWIHQLCAALDFAHDECGIVHSDLKPANLLINAQEELKVTDFALAQTVRAESSRRGLVKGLYSGLGFLSPQQVMGAEPSKADDIYSLGATIFDLLTGTPPFYKGEVFAQICSLKPPSMTGRVKELEIQDDPVSPVWEDVVARCLAKNPADRPQSAKEVLQLLERKELPKTAAVVVGTKPDARGKIAEPLVEIKTPEPDKIKPDAEVLPAIEPPLEISPRQKSPAPATIAVAVLFAALILAAGIFGFQRLKHSVPGAAVNAATNSPAAATKPGTPGSLDKSFAAGTGADNEVRSIAVQPDGEILIGGKFTFFNGSNVKGIARLNADGSLDTSFKFHANGAVDAMALQNDGDGNIFAGGDFVRIGSKRHPHFARLRPDGFSDQRFGLDTEPNQEVSAIAVQPDGQVLIGGNFTMLSGKSQNRLARVNASGAADESFNSKVNSPQPVMAIAVQPDGKILVAGSFESFNGSPAGNIVRLDSDGGVDSSFSVGADGSVMAIALQSDGGILIAGDFLNVNRIPCHHLARLNPDGTVDSTFGIGDGANATVRALAIQPDGNILVGGAFTKFSGSACNRIARLNADGTLDKSFNTGAGPSDTIWQIVFQQDGKILVGGAFRSFDGTGCGGIVRLQN